MISTIPELYAAIHAAMTAQNWRRAVNVEGTCIYRITDDDVTLGCAIGCLMGPRYESWFEGSTLASKYFNKPDTVDAILDAAGIDKTNLELVEEAAEIQMLHDNSTSDEIWKRRFEDRYDWMLSYTDKVSVVVMTRLWVIEKRHGHGGLDLSVPQPESFFGEKAITGISDEAMASRIHFKYPDAILRGDSISRWPTCFNPNFVARLKTW